MIIVGTQLVNVTFFSGKAPAAHPGSSAPEESRPSQLSPLPVCTQLKPIRPAFGFQELPQELYLDTNFATLSFN